MAKKITKPSKPKPLVVVRTYSAGVHIGHLESRKGTEVTLSNAKRLWRWNGANSLHEVALKGVAATSRISEPVPTIQLLEAIEIIPASAEAVATFGSRWP